MRCLPIISLLILGINLVESHVSCRDENNQPVDWYVFYKLPKVKSAREPLVARGKGYLHITSSTVSQGWQLSSRPIDSNSSILATTLPFLQNKSEKVMWLVYTDQGKWTCLDCGHTKGVVAGDQRSGLWLVHSIPRYLDGSYPSSGYTFGQSGLCISLTATSLNSVGEFLAYNQAKFRNVNIVGELKGYYTKILAAYNGVTVDKPWKLDATLTSVDGAQFHSFAKARKFEKDLYEWVAASLQTNLFTETWINAVEVLPSSCNLTFRVMNVESMKIPLLNTTYSTHSDHSKIAISNTQTKPWVCIGDINRSVHQKKRGGGTVCLSSPQLWLAYRSLVNSTQSCAPPFKLSTTI